MHSIFYLLLLFPALISCSGGSFGEERKFNQFLQNTFDEKVQQHPELSTLLGLKSGKDQWNNLSESYLKEVHYNRVDKNLKELSQFDVLSLSKKSQLSWRIFKLLMEEEKINFDFRFYRYIVNPLFGRQSEVTAFLINTHTIENIQDAKDYIARVRGIKNNFDQVIHRLQESAKRGIIPPRFTFSKVEENIRALLKGHPMDSQRKHVLVKDFNKKISALHLSPFKKRKLNEELQQALLEFYKPAYENLLNNWLKLKMKSGNKVGLWSQPQGQEYYEFLLRKMTTTDLTPEEIHQLGLKEVQRLHLEIEQLKNKLNFKGSLLNFFNDFRNNKKFYYKSRRAYIADSNKVISELKRMLPEFFKTIPKYPVKVKQVESFREKSTGGGFYQSPSVEGNRPGVFYVNLYRMNEHPKYALKALTFHETLPGHHLQISMALDLKSLPQFRRHTYFTAFTEGWALYAERLSGEMGLYTTEYDQFGALTYELMRACRLVVDTGLHYKKWSRDRAIGYLIRNSDVSYDSAVRSVERYIVNPGQATAYMIGFLKILELRELAKKTLGEEFDIREFHHQVLKNGAVPLTILEENIRQWLDAS